MKLSNNSDRVQINLDISPELYQTVQNVAKQINGDTAEVLLKGVMLMQVAATAKQEGKHIWIADENNQLETEIIGI
jgi:hypothetical protein